MMELQIGYFIRRQWKDHNEEDCAEEESYVIEDEEESDAKVKDKEESYVVKINDKEEYCTAKDTAKGTTKGTANKACVFDNEKCGDLKFKTWMTRHLEKCDGVPLRKKRAASQDSARNADYGLPSRFLW